MEVEVLRAIDDYRKWKAFKEKIIEALAYTYEYGFNDCKAKVIELFPYLDLWKVFLPGGEVNEEAAERVKYKRKQLKKSQRRKSSL